MNKSTNSEEEFPVKNEEIENYSMVSSEDQEDLNRWRSIKSKIKTLQNEINPKNKAKLAREIAAEMAGNFISISNLFRKYPTIEAEYLKNQETLKQLSSYMNSNIEALQQSAIPYFKNRYSNGDFSFFNKQAGDQIGQILRIKYVDEHSRPREVSYYIKTHQHGSTSRDGGARAVDLKELFVYKVLEHIGVGPKAHFFSTPFSNQSGFYIATRDASFSQSIDKQAHKAFYTYESFKEKEKLDELKELQSANPKIIYGLTKIDMLSRFFMLHDVATNSENFGFLCKEENIKSKIIDFRVHTYGAYKYPPDKLLQGFIEGNGTYNYTGFIGVALRNREEKEKINEAKQIVVEMQNGAKTSLLDAIKIALDEVLVYAKGNTSLWGESLDSATKDLTQYSDDVVYNFNQFVSELESKIQLQRVASATSKLGLHS